MATLVDAWKLIREELNARHEAEKKRKQFDALTGQPLNYQIISDIARTVGSQKPGFYSVIRFKDGNQWELGVTEPAKPPRRQADETF